MDWLLLALAAFNLISMALAFTPRVVPRKSVPFGIFAFALPATELAWIWLPLQITIAALLAWGGALETAPGQLGLLVLLLTWPGLAWSIRAGLASGTQVEAALVKTLGSNYAGEIAPEYTSQLRSQPRFSDWRNPVGFGHSEVEVIRNLPYAGGGVRQQLNIYRPRKLPQELLPVLLQIHGGAFMLGSKDQQAQPLLHTLATRSWIGVSINYRLSPSVGFPTHLEDCKRALCWIREHGAEYGMDTNFVAVTGGSAGGLLTSLMGLTANRAELQQDHPDVDTSVQACVPLYGVYDLLSRFDQHPNRQVFEEFMGGRVLHESPTENPGLWDLASPITQVHAGAPPFMVIHGQLDSLAVVSEGRYFSEKLEEVSEQPVVYLELSGAEHSFDIVRSPRTEYAIDGIHRFLEWTRSRH